MKVTPKFYKQFGNVGAVISKVLAEYKQEVEARSFPSPSYTPYKISVTDNKAFTNALQKVGLDGAADTAVAATKDANKFDGRAHKMKNCSGIFSARVAV